MVFVIAIVTSSMKFISLYISRWWHQTWDTSIYFMVVSQSEASVSTEHGIKENTEWYLLYHQYYISIIWLPLDAHVHKYGATKYPLSYVLLWRKIWLCHHPWQWYISWAETVDQGCKYLWYNCNHSSNKLDKQCLTYLGPVMHWCVSKLDHPWIR